MKRRFVQIDGVLHEVGSDYIPEPRADYHVMPDIKPYRSMADGTIVSSRSSHREMLKRNHVIEVGNEVKHLKGYGNYHTPDPSRKDVLIREVHRARDAQRNGRKYGPTG